MSHQLSVRNTRMRLCSSIDPATGEQDGPYLLMGTEEYTMEEVGALIDALRELRGFSRDTTIPSQPDKAASERK